MDYLDLKEEYSKVRSVAIVGLSKSSLFRVKDTPAEKIWTVNHTPLLVINEPEDYPLPRVDLLGEIHKEEVIRDGAATDNKNEIYWKWLKEPLPFPILMQKEYIGRIPSAIEYPLKDVQDDLLKGLLSQDDEPQEDIFTSSFDYLMALAIHFGVPEIYTYGYAFGSHTDYKYQRNGGYTWMGIAMGRGIKIIVPKEDKLFAQKLYGFDTWVRVGADLLRKDLKDLEKYHADYKQQVNELVTAGELRRAGETQCMMFRYDGARQNVRMYIKQCKNGTKLGRQFFETDHHNHMLEMDYWKAQHNTLEPQWIKDQENKELEKKFMFAQNMMFSHEGAAQIALNYSKVCDLYESNLEMKEWVKTVSEADNGKVRL